MTERIKYYDPGHELANVITHALGLTLSIIFAPILIWKVGVAGSTEATLGALIFGIGLLAVYCSSTLYHASKHPKRRACFRMLDHIAIFILIGGSYTAYILKFYNEPAGYFFIAAQWLLILLGVILKVRYTGKFEFVSLTLYLFIGWMVVFIYDPVITTMDSRTLFWLIVGGLSYTVGVLFYVLERLPYNHAIWHLFVLGGSAGHFISLYHAASA